MLPWITTFGTALESGTILPTTSSPTPTASATMRFDNAGCWELAAAPFGAPDESASESSSAVFDPIDGSYEAQCFLRTVIPRSFLPASSRQMGDAVFPAVALLRDAEPRAGNLLLSTLCADHGVHGEWRPFAYEALLTIMLRQQEDDLDKQLDEARMFDDWRRYNSNYGYSATWSPGLQLEPRQQPTPGQYLELATIWKNDKGPQAKTVEKDLGLDFSKQPIRSASKASMMPAPDTMLLIWKRQYELENGSFTEIEEDENSLQPLPSAFSDTTADSEGSDFSRVYCSEPDDASLAFSTSYASSEGSYMINPFYNGGDAAPSDTEGDHSRLPISARPSFESVAEEHRPLWDEQALAMHNIPFCSSPEPIELARSTSESSLLSFTPSIAAALAYETARAPCSDSSGSYEAVALYQGSEGEDSERNSEADDDTGPLRTFLLDDDDEGEDRGSNTGPLRTFFLEDEDNDEGEYMTDDAGHTPFNLSPVSSYGAPTAPDETDIDDLFHYIGDFLSPQTTQDTQVLHSETLATTSSIEEAEAALIEHYLGDEILDPDLECALLFATHQPLPNSHDDDEDFGAFEEGSLTFEDISPDFEFTFTFPSSIPLESTPVAAADVDGEIRRPDARGSLTLSYSAPAETIEDALERLMDEYDPFDEARPPAKRRKIATISPAAVVSSEVRMPINGPLTPDVIEEMLEDCNAFDEDASNSGLALCRTSSRNDNSTALDGIPEDDVLENILEDLSPPGRHLARNLQESFSSERPRLQHTYASHDYRRYSVCAPSNLHHVSRQNLSETVKTEESEHRILEVRNPDPPSRTATLSPLSPEARHNYRQLNRLSQMTTASLSSTIYGPGELSSSRTRTSNGEFHLTTQRKSVKRPATGVRLIKRAVSKGKKVVKKISNALDCTGRSKWDIERKGTFELCDVDPFGVRTHSHPPLV